MLITRHDTLTTALQAEIERVVGALPQDESPRATAEKVDYLTRLTMTEPGSCIWWLVRPSESPVVGFAVVNRSNPITPSLHLAVSPERRREGIGGRLLREAQLAAGGSELRVWNVGRTESGRRFAGRQGLRHLRDITLVTVDMRTHAPVAPEVPAGFESSLRASHELEPNWETVVTDAYSDSSVAKAVRSSDWWPKASVHCITRSSTGELVGILVVRRVTYGSEVGLENHLMAVATVAQGAGIGRSLTQILVWNAAQLGIRWVVSYVDTANESAIRAHEKAGFITSNVSSLYAT